jgi:hypothetical protein
MSSVPGSNEEQGALFGVDVKVIGSGTTDPLSYETERRVTFTDAETPLPEAVEPDTVEHTLGEDRVLIAVQDEVAARRNSLKQSGLHSPLQRDGTYLAVRVGDFLPDFGKVTYRNFVAAYKRASELETDRLQRIRLSS